MINDKYLVNINASLKQVLEKIDMNGIGTIFVVDSKNNFKGLLTDGDIRRKLLDGKNLETKCSEILNNKPKHVFEDSPNTVITELARKYKVIPVLSKTNKIVDFFSFQEFSKIPISAPSIKGNELKYVMNCLETNWISSQGSYVNEFEKNFSKYTNKEHSISVTNGTAAIELALKVFDIGFGDEVIVPDFTFGATANAVISCGARPVFVDVCPKTWLIDMDLVKKAITKKTRAIILVDIYGNPCDAKEFVNTFHKKNIKIISDCAESVGAFYDGNHAGYHSDASTFSFFANKSLTTGEGGMLCLNNKKDYNKGKILRDHGMDPSNRYYHLFAGNNLRMTNIQAAIGLAQLERVDDILKTRKEIFNSYNKFFEGNEFIGYQKVKKDNQQGPWLYTINVKKDLNKLTKSLEQEHIDIRRVFQPLSEMPPFKKYTSILNGTSKKIYQSAISLPTFNEITKKEIEYVSKTLITAIEKC